jgi:multicomponent K+:H+ antiporter subunit F
MTGTFTAWALQVALAAFALALLMNAWRLFRGPGTPDRILALDTLYVNSLALTILLGIQFNTSVLFEAALLVAMLGFIGTVALAKYLSRGDLVE